MNPSKLLADFNYTFKYAKYLPDQYRRETWEEAVNRVMSMHWGRIEPKFSTACYNYTTWGDDTQEALYHEFQAAHLAYLDKKILGSQRTLQFGGEGVLKHHMRSYNCATSYCDRPRFFAESLYMLLCGVGVGFSVQKHHVDQLPPLASLEYLKDIPDHNHVIKDSIEGWSEALNALVNFYFGLSTSEDFITGRPVFDYSQIRKRGAQLSTGGKAPGPEPLKNALEKIEAVFLRAINRGDKKLRPIDTYDIVMHASDAVLSGGVRRSATIAVFSPDDEEMMNAKTGNWFTDNPQRARSNNSALLLRSDNNKDKFLELIERTKEFGEPGFIFADSLEYLFNPCVESSQCPVLIKKDGVVVENYTLDLLKFTDREHWNRAGYTFESGWQVCNLVETNASVWETAEEAKTAVRLATVLGTIQGTYTDVGYLLPASKEIIEREVLVGVSMTGMMDSPKLAFNPKLLEEMAKIVVKTNKRWSDFLDINQSARLCLVKPAGNSTVNLSIDYPVASGIHPHHAGRFIRRVQIHKDDPVGQWFAKSNPHLVEHSVWSSNGTDNVISFPLEIKPGAITKDKISAIDFLEKVKLVQQHWVIPGTARPRSCEGNVNNVSCTCHVKQNEWEEVAEYIWNNRVFFSGLSLLGESGDFLYQQAPMQRIYFQGELEEKFGSANVGAAKHFKRHLERRYGSLYNVMMPLRMVLLGYPTEKAVEGTSVHPELLWGSYLKLRSMLHIQDIDSILLLISSIDHEELWHRLMAKLTEVDYSQFVEFEDGTTAIDTVACAGGSCEIDFKVT